LISVTSEVQVLPGPPRDGCGDNEAMRLTKEELSARVVVRRVAMGSAPFRWEVHWADRIAPVFVSSTRFANMDAAYRDGEARLPEFMPPRQAPRLGLDERVVEDEAAAA
jgi:hypothetical protein